ncbi:hypothetical protein K503DRAFT_776699 [Rhizopogon vinicolor AM-OR11-026]|uniref:Uncharacterized protein n=1 Tax=Rhizopogon vinicolor AM-OR11-026 TaxID=1314800 RepID=A0A1B7MIH6_9AGAM|nr:hypothetical protein K503DRAFT_776699 [Rhizopogon vinicolor AM-OR11-026]
MPGNRCHIPAAVKQQWVTMSAHMSPRAIAQVTHASYRTVNRVRRLSRLTGAVVSKAVIPVYLQQQMFRICCLV